jgi:putative transposase
MALKGTLDVLVSADAEAFTRLRAAESIGRPLGNDRFLAKIERATKRSLKPRKRGPKPQTRTDASDR